MPDEVTRRAGAGHEWPDTATVHQRAAGRLRIDEATLTALRQRDTQYRAIVERAPVGIVLMDPHGLILVANPAFQHMTGYRADELHSRHFRDITHPDDIPTSLALVRRLLAGHGSLN
jgi:PAS domain-containing protein